MQEVVHRPRVAVDEEALVEVGRTDLLVAQADGPTELAQHALGADADLGQGGGQGGHRQLAPVRGARGAALGVPRLGDVGVVEHPHRDGAGHLHHVADLAPAVAGTEHREAVAELAHHVVGLGQVAPAAPCTHRLHGGHPALLDAPDGITDADGDEDSDITRTVVTMAHVVSGWPPGRGPASRKARCRDEAGATRRRPAPCPGSARPSASNGP